MAKGLPAAPPKRATKAPTPRDPVKSNDRNNDAAIGRPRESAEPKRDLNFKIEKSIADKFDALADAHRIKNDGRRHGAGKDFLVHMIETYPFK